MDAESPASARAINWTIEILQTQEACILVCIEHVAQIFITVVEQAVVVRDCIAIAIHYFIPDIVDGVNEVEVDLIAVIILHWSQVELVCHAIAQEACIRADVAH